MNESEQEALIIGGNPIEAQKIVDRMNQEARLKRERSAAGTIGSAATNPNGAAMDPRGELFDEVAPKIRSYIVDI